ncbi:MAG TPA: ATP-binding protein [Actinocrinis sp.]|uniref:sensor histidine kinase n=1 Tax=Actinocrinis sp. TaxID=1920516 RepID=UPI002DDDA22B|nr:ATP-binding protein [Actinocrinis sp.]HEV3170884.1 ATP-binding protein [Actinocrinis sp.]
MLVGAAEAAEGNRADGANAAGAGEAPTALRVERVLAWAMGFFRAGGIAQASVVLAMAPAHFPRFGESGALLAAIAAESAVLIAVCVRAGRIRTGWISADVLVCAAGLTVNAALTTSADGNTWADFMYPFTIIASIGIGLGYRSLFTVLGAAAFLATTYGTSAVLVHHDPAWNTVPNSISYLPNTVVAWAAARYLRQVARASDVSRAQAVARADELAGERERARHSRMLHDRVLQTMETLARGEWVPDRELRSHIAVEAAWLRALVEGAPMEAGPGDLLSALQAVARRKTRIGLNVELNTVGLRDAAPPGGLESDVVEAVADAVHEALTNVAKHAGVDAAVVRAYSADGRIVVSVLDQGCGFDPSSAAGGLGLERSIRARLTAVGGEARIDSQPRAGTYVELSVPARGSDGLPAHPPEQGEIPGE